MSFSELIEPLKSEAESKGYKRAWVWFKFKETLRSHPEEIGESLPSENDLKSLAIWIGYKPGWGFIKHKEIQDILNENEGKPKEIPDNIGKNGGGGMIDMPF